MISVMLVDDQQVILTNLSQLIDAGGYARVVATEATGKAAIDTALKLRPDVILLDVSLPDMSGIEVAKNLVEQWREVRILAVSAYAEPIYVRSMMNAGAKGYLHKDKISRELSSAIGSLMDGGTWIGEGLAARSCKNCG